MEFAFIHKIKLARNVPIIINMLFLIQYCCPAIVYRADNLRKCNILCCHPFIICLVLLCVWIQACYLKCNIPYDVVYVFIVSLPRFNCNTDASRVANKAHVSPFSSLFQTSASVTGGILLSGCPFIQFSLVNLMSLHIWSNLHLDSRMNNFWGSEQSLCGLNIHFRSYFVKAMCWKWLDVPQSLRKRNSPRSLDEGGKCGARVTFLSSV